MPAGLFGIGWVLFERTDGIFALFGLIAAALALLTVYCTGMIYASLRTIRQWHQPLVPWVYIALALATGAMLMLALIHVFDMESPWFSYLTAALIALALLLKQRYWATIDSEKKTWTIGDATGLGKHGQVRVLDPPHTQANYVMREMGYAVARNHAEKLRRLVRLAAFLVPGALCLITVVPTELLAAPAAVLAVLTAAVGVAVERWLFFAEAEQVSITQTKPRKARLADRQLGEQPPADESRVNVGHRDRRLRAIEGEAIEAVAADEPEGEWIEGDAEV